MVRGPAVSVGECLTLGALISGALVNRMIWVCPGRLVPPEPFAGDGSGNAGWGARMGSDTLLGPEETDIGGPAVAGLLSV